MSGTRPKYYWDACVWIAWLTAERAYADHLSNMEEYAAQADAGKIVLVTSSLTRGEILETKIGAQAATNFQDSLKRPNIVEASADPRVASLAGELRNYYQGQKETGANAKTLAMLDAVHLATAILYGVDQFHTFDDGKKGKHLGLLGLSGTLAAKYPLVICKPQLAQGRLTGF